jgi:hypothetical protein
MIEMMNDLSILKKKSFSIAMLNNQGVYPEKLKNLLSHLGMGQRPRAHPGL